MAPFFKPGTSLYATFYGGGTDTVGTVAIPTNAEQSAGPTMSNFAGYFSSTGGGIDVGDVLRTAGSIVGSFQGPLGPLGPLGPIVPINPETGQVERPQYQVAVHPGAACWDKPRKNGMPNSRVRVKLQRQPDGTFAVVRYCAPKRMNPLNPRALSRAARRIGSFQRIASNIEKIVQKACRTGIGRGRRSTRPRLPSNCNPCR